MLIKVLEIISFVTSAGAFSCGGYRLFRKGIPKYFQLYICAAGCYMLEELWVIVNSLFGNGGEDGLVTVRLFGFFGCLCFMLSANANEFDHIVDEGNNKKARVLSFAAPLFLLLLYLLFAFSPASSTSLFEKIVGFLSISPALLASHFSLKHLLLPEDAMGFLKLTRSLDILALIFYVVNFLYPTASLYLPPTAMSFYDLFIALMLLGIVLLCGKEAKKWLTLI